MILLKILRKCSKIQFARFFTAGAVSSAVDWGVFYCLAVIFNIYYLAALLGSFIVGSIVNYALNKYFTFKCTSNKIAKQFTSFLVVAFFNLIFSFIVMYLFVDILSMDKMISRIVTTGLLCVFNYIVLKKIIFNKKFFD
jgi:putative flippase GtrA